LCKNCSASCACAADAGGVKEGESQIREARMQSMGYRDGGHVEYIIIFGLKEMRK
jgi:hypothetical protein